MSDPGKIFVIGGNGFVGSAYVRLLQAAGADVTVITRANYADYVGAACDLLINANGNSKKFLSKEDPKRDFLESVTSVRNSLVDFKFNTYVFLSTSDVYADCSQPGLTREDTVLDVAAQSPYGFHKYLAEQCVTHAAKRWLIIRQGGFVGTGLKKNAVFDVLYGDKLWVHPDSRFQFIDTDISAQLVLRLVQQGVCNRVLNLTARGTVSVAEIMEWAGRQVPVSGGAVPVTYEISTDAAAALVELPDSRTCVETFVRRVVAENTKG